MTSLLLVAFGGLDGLAADCALAMLPGVLLTSGLTSHGAALPVGATLGIAVDWLHIVGATAWIGGLVGWNGGATGVWALPGVIASGCDVDVCDALVGARSTMGPSTITGSSAAGGRRCSVGPGAHTVPR